MPRKRRTNERALSWRPLTSKDEAFILGHQEPRQGALSPNGLSQNGVFFFFLLLLLLPT